MKLFSLNASENSWHMYTSRIGPLITVLSSFWLLHPYIPSLNVCIWLIYSEVEDGLYMFFARRPEDEFEDEVKEMDYMRQFQGIGFLVPRHSFKSKPILIPSYTNLKESVTLEVMQHRPTFVVVIWSALRSSFLLVESGGWTLCCDMRKLAALAGIKLTGIRRVLLGCF